MSAWSGNESEVNQLRAGPELLPAGRASWAGLPSGKLCVGPHRAAAPGPARQAARVPCCGWPGLPTRRAFSRQALPPLPHARGVEGRTTATAFCTGHGLPFPFQRGTGSSLWRRSEEPASSPRSKGKLAKSGPVRWDLAPPARCWLRAPQPTCVTSHVLGPVSEADVSAVPRGHCLRGPMPPGRRRGRGTERGTETRPLAGGWKQPAHPSGGTEEEVPRPPPTADRPGVLSTFGASPRDASRGEVAQQQRSFQDSLLGRRVGRKGHERDQQPPPSTVCPRKGPLTTQILPPSAPAPHSAGPLGSGPRTWG